MNGLKLRARCSSSWSQLERNAAGYALNSSPSRPACSASHTASAASIPDFIAAWLPLIRDALRKPASSPIRQPPGKTNFGSDCRPPAEIARAPYAIRLPPSSVARIAGCVL
jgi:hypothetical protein